MNRGNDLLQYEEDTPDEPSYEVQGVWIVYDLEANRALLKKYLFCPTYLTERGMGHNGF